MAKNMLPVQVKDSSNAELFTADNPGQVSANEVEAALSTLNGKDFATQTTLAALLAKIIASPATEAKQDVIVGHIDGIESALSTLNSKDFATQTTLTAILAKIISAPSTEAKQDILIGHVDGVENTLANINNKDFATQTTLAAILAKMISSPATEANQTALNALIGEVQASPTANTLLARIKSLETELTDIKSTAGIKKITDALPAGGNVIGKISIDQTTPGVTNAVQLTGSSLELYGATVATRPLANAVATGAIFMAVDTQELWQSNGTSWVVI